MNDTKRCPYCAEEIKREAVKCKHCGEMLNTQFRTTYESQNRQTIIVEKKWSPGIAALLSFLIPGAGQIYKGRVLEGLVWFVAVTIGYFLLLFPGLFLHFICILTAASGDPYQ